MINIIHQLRSTGSSNEKINILKRNQGNPTLTKVLLYTYSNKVVLGIKKIPAVEEYRGEMSLDTALDRVFRHLHEEKLRGHAATCLLRETLESLSEEDAEVLRLVVAKDLKAGVNAQLVNKVHKNLIPKTPYMRCGVYTPQAVAKSIKFPALVQRKADGSFVNIFPTTLTFLSRSGLDKDFLGVFDEVITRAKEFLLGDYVLHGELLYRGEGTGRQEGNGIVNKADKGTISLEEARNVYIQLWDIVPVEDFYKGSYKVPYQERFSLLRELVAHLNSSQVELVPTREVSSLSEALAFTSSQMDKGYEGAVLKDKSLIWEDKTSKKQLKLKLEIDADVRITGFTPGKGKFAKTFGAIQFQTDDGLVKGQTSGMPDAVREAFHANRESLIGKVMSVTFNDLTQAKGSSSYALSHPRLKELREDKEETDTLERILLLKEMAINL